MAENIPATPPATDQAALQKTINDAITAALPGALGTVLKPITDQLAELKAKPAAETAPAGKEKSEPITLDAIGKLIDSKLSTVQQTQQAKQQRDAFVAEKLKDLPAAYQNQLGSDPAKWAQEEQAIRDSYKADLEKSGLKLPSVGDPNADKGKTPDKVPADLSKLSPQQLAVKALSESQPVTRQAANVTTK